MDSTFAQQTETIIFHHAVLSLETSHSFKHLSGDLKSVYSESLFFLHDMDTVALKEGQESQDVESGGRSWGVQLGVGLAS